MRDRSGSFLFILTLCVIAHAHFAAGAGQHGSPLEWLPVAKDSEEFVMVQRTSDGQLLLTPNEVFFPKLGLRAEGTGPKSED